MANHETRNGKPQTAVGYMSAHQHDLVLAHYGHTFKAY